MSEAPLYRQRCRRCSSPDVNGSNSHNVQIEVPTCKFQLRFVPVISNWRAFDPLETFLRLETCSGGTSLGPCGTILALKPELHPIRGGGTGRSASTWPSSSRARASTYSRFPLLLDCHSEYLHRDVPLSTFASNEDPERESRSKGNASM